MSKDISLRLNRTQVSTDCANNCIIVSRPVGHVLAYLVIAQLYEQTTMLAILTRLHKLSSISDEQFLLFHNTQRKHEQEKLEEELSNDNQK